MDQDMINCAPYVTSADTGTKKENTKDSPFQNNFVVHMISLLDILHHVFGGTTFWFHAKPSIKINNG